MDDFEQAYARALAAGGAEAEVDGAASALAAAGTGWDAAAARLAARVVRECAARGWEPADLVRMAGRELDARRRRLAEGLTEGLAARPGAGPGADGSGSGSGSGRGQESAAALAFTGFATAERLDRFSAATALVELLCLWGRLPRITAQVAPAPAGAVPGEPKMLARIRALLAKAESTGFPEEAEALSAKAQHLMTRHSIDAALLTGAAADGGPGTRRIGVDRPYEGPKALLLDAVAEANRCEAVWSADFGFSTVVGHGPDLDAVELLYTSLLVQADRALHRGASRSRDFRESFLIAYAGRVRVRLAAATAAATAEEAAAHPAPGLLPALAARDLAVRTTTRRLFPTTSTSRLKGRDAAGWEEGEAAADRARL